MMTVQEGTEDPVTHIRQSHSPKTFDGSYPSNVFTEQPILNAGKGSGCQTHCHISEKGSHEHSIGSNVWYPPVLKRTFVYCTLKD